MSEDNCIVVGASHAGVSLALQLRKEGWTGRIQLLSAESELPYHRPPLSKELLAGDKTLDGIRLRPEKIYQDNTIDLMLGAEVVEIDPASRKVVLQNRRVLHYSKLALCTGSLVRKLTIEGDRQWQNLCYLRTAADAAALSTLAQSGTRAVIIGAGYIGLETAAVLSQQGVSVTVLELADRILNRVTSQAMSTYLAALHRDHGVDIRTSVEVTSLKGDDRIESVQCGDGESIATDLVIAGIGIVPNTTLAEQAGLAIDQGIIVDAFTRSSDPNIHAAGDCTLHPSGLYGRNLRLESVQNANDQARVAAANLCGKQVAYDAVPWFWSDQYQVKLQSVGIGTGYDEVVTRGDIGNSDGAGFVLFYFKEGVLIAADCINRPKEFMACKQLVKNRMGLNSELVQDEAIDPVAWLGQTRSG